MLHRIVIVGASLAGLRAAETLRDRGFDGELTLIGEEPHLPYDRPPLSKQVLQGTWEPDQTFFRKKEGYDALALDMRLGVRATSVNLRAKRVTLAGGTFADYDRLIIATGARVRTLPGICAPRGFARPAQSGRRHRAAGGIDAGDACRNRGSRVHRSRGRRLLPRARPACHRHRVAFRPAFPVLGPTLCEMVAAMHRDHGVDLRTGVAVTDVFGKSRVAGVALSDGSRIAADVVVVGIGVTPNTQWLEGSGLTLDNGIVCNGSGEAALDVYAAGDVARVANRSRRFAANRALDQRGRTSGACRRERARRSRGGPSFSSVPYFWSDQLLPQDPVHRSRTSARRIVIVDGSLADRRLTALYRRADRVDAGWAAGRRRRRRGARRHGPARRARQPREAIDRPRPAPRRRSRRLHCLVERADVFATSYLERVRQRLQIDVEHIQAVNPSIVYTAR